MSGDKIGAIQLGCVARLLTEDEQGDLHHRDPLECFEVTDSFDFAEALFLPVRLPRQRAGFGEQA